MEWQAAASRLREVMNLSGEPVGILYAKEPLEGGDDSPIAVCEAMKRASNGAIINLSKDNSSCPGGTYYIGLGERRGGVEDFLVDVEHIFSSRPVARAHFVHSVAPPTGLTPYVCIAPVVSMPIKPDLVLIVCNPMQASRILGLVAYDGAPGLKLSAFGAACQTAITNPLMNEQVDVSFIDVSARKRAGFADDELIVSLPYREFMRAVANIDYSIFGTAKPSAPLR
ncbi:MAG: DUF169 domain-containing protein [Armatimonadota bacterium]|nr:DUF169 domain-containing protein [Armatimonadota bacterium]MDW8025405.1 DUF169 domain-containing protein [Armatimonadota bacterium]